MCLFMYIYTCITGTRMGPPPTPTGTATATVRKASASSTIIFMWYIVHLPYKYIYIYIYLSIHLSIYLYTHIYIHIDRMYLSHVCRQAGTNPGRAAGRDLIWLRNISQIFNALVFQYISLHTTTINPFLVQKTP